MTRVLAEFFVSGIVIVTAGVFLSRSADRFAEITRFGKLIVGGVLLAGATSLPELFVTVNSVRMQMPDLAVGNLMGSCLLNLLVLAIGDLLNKKKGTLFSHRSSAHAMAASVSISLLALVAIAVSMGPQTQNFSFLELGLGSLAILVSYALGLRMIYYNQQLVAKETKESRTDDQISKSQELKKCLTIFFIAAVAIFFAAPVMAQAAGSIAESTGLSATFIGTTLVALCTVLPELVATITCIRIGAFDMAVGNIFGSNCFNIALIPVIDLFHPGPILAAVSSMHVLTSLCVILCTSVAVIGQLYNIERRYFFIEPDAFVIIGLVLGCLALLYNLSYSLS